MYHIFHLVSPENMRKLTAYEFVFCTSIVKHDVDVNCILQQKRERVKKEEKRFFMKSVEFA